MCMLSVFKSVIELMVRIWSIRFTVGTHTVSIGACLLFTSLASLIIWFLRRMAD